MATVIPQASAVPSRVEPSDAVEIVRSRPIHGRPGTVTFIERVHRLGAKPDRRRS